MNQSSLPQAVLTSPEGEVVKFYIEVADDQAERSEGLMNRTELPLNHGMLFVFENEQPVAFWMKNTLIPLDILYIDATNTVVAVETMEPCKVQDCPTYPSGKPALYALEINAGLAEQYGLVVGSTIDLPDVL